MTCHAHRCCRKPAGTGAPAAAAAAADFVVLGSDDAALIDGAATFLRGAGACVETHELGLRLSCRGSNGSGMAALAGLADALSVPARRALRVAVVPHAADGRAFQRALLMSQSLHSFIASPARSRPEANAAPTDTHALGDVFKGQSLE